MFLQLNFQFSRLEQTPEGNLFASLGFQCKPLNAEIAPVYPRLM